MRLNSDGHTTVLACWDADRLDLARVGIQPQPQRLCTGAARDASTIGAAMRMAEGLSRRASSARAAST